jgi:hypothetical protein
VNDCIAAEAGGEDERNDGFRRTASSASFLARREILRFGALLTISRLGGP